MNLGLSEDQRMMRDAESPGARPKANRDPIKVIVEDDQLRSIARQFGLSSGQARTVIEQIQLKVSRV